MVSRTARKKRFGVTQRVMRMLLPVVAVCGVAVSVDDAAAQDQRARERVEIRGIDFVTVETQRAIDDGLAFLARQQKPDGSIGSGRYFERDVAVTSLAGMALLAGGHTPGRGKYGKETQKCVDFVLSRCEPTGFIRDKDSQTRGPMYGHGFATLFLAEVYGMAPNKDLRPKLERAVKLIVNTQNDEGGWRYDPVPKDADVSVTVCEMMALRAARNAGIYVPKETVERCVDYLKRCQNPDGGFRYQLRRPGSEFPRSAGAVVALYSAGIYEGREIDDALDYLTRYRPGRDVLRLPNYYYYGHYYAVQAMWQSGGSRWEAWYPAVRDELLKSQDRVANGSWFCPTVCNEFGTAMACLILQMPNCQLPIFER